MGIYNQSLYESGKCPITGLTASYDVPPSGYDGIEYRVKELNPSVIIRISGSSLDTVRLNLLGKVPNVRQMIVESAGPYFEVDTRLLNRFGA